MIAKRAKELTKEYLINLYHEKRMTIDKMVEVTGRSRSTIIRYMNKFHIRRRKRYYL